MAVLSVSWKFAENMEETGTRAIIGEVVSHHFRYFPLNLTFLCFFYSFSNLISFEEKKKTSLPFAECLPYRACILLMCGDDGHRVKSE